MRTKRLTSEEYGGIPFSIPEVIKHHVDREALIEWALQDRPKTPPFHKPPKVRLSTLIKRLIIHNAKQLIP